MALERTLTAEGWIVSIVGAPPVFAGSFSWASRPNPATTPVGAQFRATDMGNATFTNTGTYWRPIGGAITLAQLATPASVTGTTTETALATVVVPGGLLGASGVLRVTPAFTLPSNANNKTLSLRLGGQLASQYVITTVSAGLQMLLHIRNRTASTQVSSNAGAGSIGLGSGGVGFGALTVDTTVDQPLIISATLGSAADTVTLESYSVEALVP